MLSEICVVFFIYLVCCMLIWNNFVCFSIYRNKYTFYKYLILNKTKKWELKEVKLIEGVLSIIGSTFGNYKFIKLQANNKQIMNNFQEFCNEYIKVDKKYMASQPVPRLVLEFLGFSIVVVLIIFSVMVYDEMD